MPSFRYQALNADDQLVSGEIEASSVLQAIEQLEASGMLLQSIANVTSAASTAAEARPILPAPKTAFDPNELRQPVARTLAEAKQVAPALRAFSQELPPGPRRRALQNVAQIIASGNVDAAIASIRSCPEYWIPLLSAGKPATNAGNALGELVLDSERVATLRQYWWRALAYPAAVLAIAAGVFTLLSFLVIPGFRDIFADFGLQLPQLTLIVIQLSKWITSGQVLISLGACVAIGGVMYVVVRRLPAAQRETLAGFVRLPAGRSAAAAQLAGFTAELLEAGFEPGSALQIAAYASQNSAAVNSLAPQSERPSSTALVRYALRATMPTAARVRVLQATRDNFAERAERLSSWTRGLAGPFAYIVTGLVVGLIVLSLFLPLISLIQNLSGVH